MDVTEYLRFAFALVAVLALIGLAAAAARRFGVPGVVPPQGARPRLQVSASVPLDAKRRAVLLRRDAVEHLIVIGGEQDCVVETGVITPPTPVAKTEPTAPFIQLLKARA